MQKQIVAVTNTLVVILHDMLNPIVIISFVTNIGNMPICRQQMKNVLKCLNTYFFKQYGVVSYIVAMVQHIQPHIFRPHENGRLGEMSCILMACLIYFFSYHIWTIIHDSCWCRRYQCAVAFAIKLTTLLRYRNAFTQ